MKRKNKGFTLVELIITMTIVVILSLVSWPIYRSYHLKEVSMLGEGYALLGAIKDAQIHYYNEYGYFLNPRDSIKIGSIPGTWTPNDPVLGINVMNNRYFSKFSCYARLGDSSGIPNNVFAYAFTAGVMSKDAGTIIMPYNLTTRGELTIIGNGTTTIDSWAH